jgi:hypothetical protein
MGGGTFRCPDQTLSGERVFWAFHISRRIQESSGGGLGTRIGPTGALLFTRAGEGERYCGVTWALCLGRVLTVHEGYFIRADRVLFTLTVVGPWAVCLFVVLSGPYRPYDHDHDNLASSLGNKSLMELKLSKSIKQAYLCTLFTTSENGKKKIQFNCNLYHVFTI